jgi:hypothetical protein
MASEQGQVMAGMAPEIGKWRQIRVKTASRHFHFGGNGCLERLESGQRWPSAHLVCGWFSS